MRNLFFILFTATTLFAQVAPNQDFVRDCFYNPPFTMQQYRINNPKGMQLSVTEYDAPLQSGEPSILQNVDISGTITSVTDTACAEYTSDEGEKKCDVYEFYQYDEKKDFYVKKISLNNFKAYHEVENPMVKALDSNWIFISLDENVKEGDSILIKNYSVLYTDIWDQAACLYKQYVFFTGDVTVNPKELPDAIQKRAPANASAPKFHNRDAAGKALNNCDARKAKY